MEEAPLTEEEVAALDERRRNNPLYKTWKDLSDQAATMRTEWSRKDKVLEGEGDQSKEERKRLWTEYEKSLEAIMEKTRQAFDALSAKIKEK